MQQPAVLCSLAAVLCSFAAVRNKVRDVVVACMYVCLCYLLVVWQQCSSVAAVQTCTPCSNSSDVSCMLSEHCTYVII